MNLYYLGNARNFEQAERMRQLEASGTCIFCPPQIGAEPQEGLVLAVGHWIVRHNDYKYSGARLHLLAIPRRHVTDLTDLSDEALAEFWQVIRRVRRRYELTYYGLGARCGDCAFTGGTIAHVHVHLVVGAVENAQHEPVRLKLSSRPASGNETDGRA